MQGSGVNQYRFPHSILDTFLQFKQLEQNFKMIHRWQARHFSIQAPGQRASKECKLLSHLEIFVMFLKPLTPEREVRSGILALEVAG